MALLTNSLKLNNGFEMPLLGLGTWKSKAGEVEVAVSLLDFTRIGFRVKEIWYGSSSGQFFFAFFSQFWLYLATN